MESGSLRQLTAVDALVFRSQLLHREQLLVLHTRPFFDTVSTALTIPVCDDGGKYPAYTSLGQLGTNEDNHQVAGRRECTQ